MANLSMPNHNVRFSVDKHRVGIMQYVYAPNPVCIVLLFRHRGEVPRQAVDIVNPEYNDDSSHLTYIVINMKFQLIVLGFV